MRVAKKEKKNVIAGMYIGVTRKKRTMAKSRGSSGHVDTGQACYDLSLLATSIYFLRQSYNSKLAEKMYFCSGLLSKIWCPQVSRIANASEHS